MAYKKRHIVYVISSGFAYRMIVYSGLAEKLIASFRLTLIICGMKRKFTPIAGVSYIYLSSYSPRKISEYSLFKKFFSKEKIEDSCAVLSWYWQKKNSVINIFRITQLFIYRQLNRFSKVKICARLFEKIEKYIFLQNRKITNILVDANADFLVVTYPVNLYEASLLFSAKKLGVTSVSHILSWDNITTKGKYSIVPDLFISWGRVMTQEIKEYYGFVDKKIKQCGVPHFDRYKNSDRRKSRTKVPTIFYGMNNHYQTPHEIEIVEWLAKRIESSNLALKLIVRPHPQGIKGYMASSSWSKRLHDLISDRVHLSLPMMEDNSDQVNFKPTDHDELSRVISSCNIAINSASTLAIESLILDKPVILTLFDGIKFLPWWKSAKRFVDYAHVAKLIDLRGVSVASSYEELNFLIQEYLVNEKLLQVERAETVEAECGSCDGRVNDRIVDAFHEFELQASESVL